MDNLRKSRESRETHKWNPIGMHQAQLIELQSSIVDSVGTTTVRARNK